MARDLHATPVNLPADGEDRGRFRTINDNFRRIVDQVERLKLSGGLIESHGVLTGLDDDDHTIYLLGAASSVDNAIARFDGTSGRQVQNSSAYVTDNGEIQLGNGSLTNPSWAFASETNTGVYRRGADLMTWVFKGVALWEYIGRTYNTKGFRMASDMALQWTSGTASGVSEIFLRRRAFRHLHIGDLNAASFDMKLAIGDSSRAGTDQDSAAGDGYIEPGNPTGNATPSILILRTPVAGASSKNYQDMTGCFVALGEKAAGAPALKRSGALAQVRLADDSNFAKMQGADPTADDDFATKRYVDSAGGFPPTDFDLLTDGVSSLIFAGGDVVWIT